MSTLKLRNLYAKKISKSLNKVIKQITLLNNIDNNIILNNNLVDIAESKTYLTGGAERKGDNSNCDTSIIDNIESSINSSTQSYTIIEQGIEMIIEQYNKQKQELLKLTDNYEREKNNHAKSIEDYNKLYQVHKEARKTIDSITKQSTEFQKLLEECTNCKTEYVTKLAQIKQQIDANNNKLRVVDSNVRRTMAEMKQ